MGFKLFVFVEEVSEPTPTRELSSELSNRHDRFSVDSSSNVMIQWVWLERRLKRGFEWLSQGTFDVELILDVIFDFLNNVKNANNCRRLKTFFFQNISFKKLA